MSYVHINGYPVPVAHGSSLTYQEVAAMRGYSFNGRYQFARSSLAAGWRFVTAPMARDEAIALAGMINHEGDGWRWDLPSGTTPNGAHYVVNELDAEAYSDARRVQQSSEAKATVVSAYGADGSRVLDWNGNAYAPFSGCQGSLIVDDGTTNIGDDITTWLASGGPTVSTDTSVKWTGNSSRKCVSTSSVQYLVSRAFTTALGDYTSGDKLTASIYVKSDTPGMTLRFSMWEKDSVIPGFSQRYWYDFTVPADSWKRVFISEVTGASPFTSSIETFFSLSQNAVGSVTFWADGFQLENNASLVAPSAYVGISDDPWGSGNGVRPAGVLDYDQWMYDFDRGFTVSLWVNLQYTGAAGSRVLFDNSSTNTLVQIYISTGDQLVFDVFATVSSKIQYALAGFTTLGWHHVVCTYSARDRTLSMYVDGALAGTDSLWSGPREFLDPSKFGIDFSIGSSGNPGSNDAKIPIGPIQVYPFVMPAQMVTGLYNSGTDDVPVPGVMPLAVHGDMFAAGQTHQYCYGQVESIDTVPHAPDSTAQWEDGACTVKFSLFADRGR